MSGIKGDPSGLTYSTVKDLQRFTVARTSHKLLSPEMTRLMSPLIIKQICYHADFLYSHRKASLFLSLSFLFFFSPFPFFRDLFSRFLLSLICFFLGESLLFLAFYAPFRRSVHLIRLLF